MGLLSASRPQTGGTQTKCYSAVILFVLVDLVVALYGRGEMTAEKEEEVVNDDAVRDQD